MAYVFLRNAHLSAEKHSQIVSAATSRHEKEPLREAVLTANPRSLESERAWNPGAYFTQVVEAEDEEDEKAHFLEANEAPDDELEA